MGFIFQTSAGAQDSLLFKVWGLVYLFSVCVHSCVVLCVCIWLYTYTHICRGMWRPKEQLSEVISLLPPYGIQGSKLGL